MKSTGLPTPRSAAAASKCVSCQIKPTLEHTREEARACLDRLGFGVADGPPTEHTGSVTAACGRCGTDPAEGFASINDTRFCHEGPDPTCYQLASINPYFRPELREVSDVEATDRPDGFTATEHVDLTDEVHALAARFSGTTTEAEPYPSDKRQASKAIAFLLGRGWRPPVTCLSAPASERQMLVDKLPHVYMACGPDLCDDCTALRQFDCAHNRVRFNQHRGYVCVACGQDRPRPLADKARTDTP